VDVYAIGIHGDYDEDALRELASSPRNFYLRETGMLADTFMAISERVQAIANSNYVFGICSPVESGGDVGEDRGVAGVDVRGDGGGCVRKIGVLKSHDITQPCPSAEPRMS
jgi:hypothetical protein